MDDEMTYCELIASVVLAGGSIADWPDLHDEMLAEIEAMVFGGEDA